MKSEGTKPKLYFSPMNYGSKLLEEAVSQFASLPGIGKKTALRLVLHLLKKDKIYVEEFSQAMIRMKNSIQRCSVCKNISDTDHCNICQNGQRKAALICVVENIRDVMAIEDTQQFGGRYHVLGGLISPLDGIGPSDIFISELVDRISNMEDKPEVILALSATIDGETTAFYLYKQLEELGVKVSQISRGIAFGGELEFADEITLGRSIAGRLPYVTHGYKSDS